jgi:hypothetical protein
MPIGDHRVSWQSDRQRFERSAGRSKRLLFAPRLMLERGLQFTRRRSRIVQRRPITAFFARLCLPISWTKPAQGRLILPRTINA